MGCNDADIAMKKATEALVGIKGELASISEDAYKRRDDVKSSKSEILTLEDQMRIVEKNQEGLIATLTKLKSKQDTYRVRANGAVCTQTYSHHISLCRKPICYRPSVA
jgi:chromosome segregation ATPase